MIETAEPSLFIQATLEVQSAGARNPKKSKENTNYNLQHFDNTNFLQHSFSSRSSSSTLRTSHGSQGRGGRGRHSRFKLIRVRCDPDLSCATHQS